MSRRKPKPAKAADPFRIVEADKVTKPGLYRMSPEAYHADPCPEPSLSNSIARTLIDYSALHAQCAHPRLAKERDEDESRRLDVGTIAHAILIGHGSRIFQIDADDYRAKAAQAARDMARAQGMTPALKPDYENALKMIAAARGQLAKIEGLGPVCVEGHGEVVLAWQEEDGLWCRAMVDWLAMIGDRARITDYKTRKGSANPTKLAHWMVDNGYDMQAAWYRRGLAALYPDLAGRIDFHFVVQEIEHPHALAVVQWDGGGQIMGEKKIDMALARWRECVRANAWPGYPGAVMAIEYPAYEEARFIAREIADEVPGNRWKPGELIKPGSAA